MTNEQAIKNFGFWCAVSAAMAFLVLLGGGPESAGQFIGAWVLEKTLSIDNLFMFIVIFKAFRTPEAIQHKCLLYGVGGVVILRGLFIGFGSALIALFHPILYLFAGALIWGAIKMWKDEEPPSEEELRQNWLVRLSSKYLNFVPDYQGDKFFITQDKAIKGTLLLLTLLVIEGTDIIFALDSVPAAMAVSQSFFIVMTSNILAVMGLRAIYFLLRNMEERFAYMKVGVAFLLCFAAAKILLPLFGMEIGLGMSLTIIIATIGASVGYSLYRTSPASV